MELILWRHADAEDGVRDEERRLTAKGKEQAGRMASWLKRELPRDTLILVSRARRAQQTAQALGRKFKTSEAVGTEATPQSVLKAADWPRGTGTVLVVGHQPTLGQAAALALTGAPADWSVQKGAIWWLATRDEGKTRVRVVLAPDQV
ncbi:MAG TPA: histidine phosphatase family protein [Burkholderiales bacterium]|jgi:phosphohistidine phosphatase